jgi:GTP-binding protein
MRPVSAEFITSVAAGGCVPTAGLPVVALVGRSNVGKSSLINALVKHRIARSGSKPGTTRLINVYRVPTTPSGIRPFILVDLPGYGYARGGIQARQTFDTITRDFFDQVTVGPRPPGTIGVQLAGILLVVDVRHPGLKSDRAALAWSLEHQYPVVIVATKSDRISRAESVRATEAHLRAFAHPEATDTKDPMTNFSPAPLITVSAETGENVGKVWSNLKELLRLL